MKFPALALILGLLALPLHAQEVRDPQPMFLDLHLDAPLSGLKDTVGNRPGLNASIGYVFHADTTGRFSMGLKLDADEFQNTSTRRGAHGVGFGPDLSVYFKPGFQGFFVNVAYLVYDWSLTNRESGSLQDQHYTRAGVSIAFGYRFAKAWSVQALYKSVSLDQDLRLDSAGLGVRMHF